MKPNFWRFCAAIAVLVSSAPLHAQEKSSKIDIAGVLKAGEMYFNPASFVLAHRQELGLTDAQVKSIDSLDKTEPRFDYMDYARPNQDERAMGEMLINVSVPIDEEVVRRGVQAKVERETRMMLDRVRSTRRLQLLLTPLQRTALLSAQMRSTYELMDGKTSETKHE
jgi:hypothetical protein